MKDKQSIQNDFSPADYKFTHLYNELQFIDLEESEFDPALYALKYALRATLDQFLSRSAHHFTYMDEISTSAISKQIKDYIDMDRVKDVEDHIGFAVLLDFSPDDSEGKSAAMMLLNIEKQGEPQRRFALITS